MFTSSALAPPRTCSIATSTAASRSSASIERAEPRRAGDVRPLADHHEPRVGADLERLQPAPPRPPRGTRDRARRHPLDDAAIWRMCSGVVPQQPPTTLTSPSSANARR